MIFFLLILLIFILYKSKLHIKNFNLNYTDIDQTKSINAIFVIIVFLAHASTYINLNDIWYNQYYIFFRNYLAQLIVTTFLFISGFGIMESIKSKKEKYINSIPRKRILNTFINFAIAIVLFIISNQIIGDYHNLKDIFIAFTGWISIGNSNWYIFDILMLYTFTWISFRIFENNNLKGIFATLILSIIFIVFLKYFKLAYWYNTVLCYVAGMFFSYYKKHFDKFVCENNKTYLFTLIIFSIAFVYIHKFLAEPYLFYYEIMSILFVLIILLVCMKFEFKNKILLYLGNNVFWIYILQRIPMRILTHLNLDKFNPYLFVIASFVSTIILAELIKLLIKLFTKIFSIILKKIKPTK